MIEFIGFVTTCLAVYGVFLNNRHNRFCFKLWLVSNLLSGIIHVYLGVYSLAARDAIFLILAVEGLMLWKNVHHEGREESRR